MKKIYSLFNGLNSFKIWMVVFGILTLSMPSYSQTGFTVDTNSGCAPLLVNFTNTSFSGNYFEWNFNDGNSAIGRDVSHSFNWQGNFNVTMNAYDTTGGSMTSLGSFNMNINVQSAPNGFNLSSSEICPSEKVYTNVWSSTPIYSAAWDFGDGSTFNGEYAEHKYNDTGNYVITLDVNTECGMQTFVRNVLVSNAAVPSVSAFVNPSSACPGDPIQFNPSNYSGKTYLWDFGDGNFSSEKNVQYAYPNLGDYEFSLTITNSCGNSNTFRDSVFIIGNQSFDSWIGINGPGSGCPGDPISLQTNASAASYSWDFGDGTFSVEARPNHIYSDTGNYTVSLHIINGCGIDTLLTRLIVIDGNLPMNSSNTYFQVWPNVACPGSQIEFKTSEATSYLWDFGDGNTLTSDQKEVYYRYDSVGIYNVTVTLFNGCGNSVSFNQGVSVESDVVPTIGLDQNFGFGSDQACPGDSLLFYAYGGASYIWSFSDGTSTNQTSPLLVGNGVVDIAKKAFSDTGTYTVTLHYFNECGNSAIDSFKVYINYNEPVNGGMPNLDKSFNACEQVDFIAIGGSSFNWDFGDGNTLLSSTGMVSHVYELPGVYTTSVVITNSCGSSESFSQTNTIGGMNAVANVKNVKCFGAKTGSINLTINGGVQPYSYSWSNGAIVKDLDSLYAGTYTVVITDKNGCFISKTYTIDSPSQMILTGNSIASSCGNSDGQASVAVGGGVAPFSYSWLPVGGNLNLITSVASGVYTVSVVDSNLCLNTLAVNVSDNSGPVAVVDSIKNISCMGYSNGAIHVSVSGGAQPYNFSWSNGASTDDITSLVAGTYGLTVTDDNGCKSTVSQTLTQPSNISVVSAISNINCYNDSTGEIRLTVSGGTPGYTFLWSNSANTKDLIGIKANTYNVLITDANSCTFANTYAVSEPIAPISIVANVNNVKCKNGNDGAINLTVSGGTTPYTYLWSNGAITKNLSSKNAGVYSLTVTDSKGCLKNVSYAITEPTELQLSSTVVDVSCFGGSNGAINVNVIGGTSPYTYNWLSGQTTKDLSNISSSVYNLTVTDNNGCYKSLISTVSQPNALVINSAITDVSCSGDSTGAIDASVSGGTLPYLYLWSNGKTTEDIDNLTASIYSLTVTDKNACSKIETYGIFEPQELSVSVTTNNSTCGNFDGSANAIVAGGVLPYSYNWSAGGGNSSSLSAVASGSYLLTILDSNACSLVEFVSIDDDGAPVVVIDSLKMVDCNGASTGAGYISVSGGQSPYTYSWSDSSVEEDLTDVIAGFYSIVVTDDNNCKASKSILITQNAPIVLSASISHVKCFAGNDGEISLLASGGSPNYTYLWSNSSTGSVISNLYSDVYSVTITDSKGCTKNTDYMLDQPAELLVTLSSSPTTCLMNNGSVLATVVGGTLPYSYLWFTTGDTLAGLSDLDAGLYEFQVFDANGCDNFDNVTVDIYNSLSANIDEVNNVSCFNGADGAAYISVFGGNLPFNYSWSNSTTLEDLVNVAAGVYTVSITDQDGCDADLSVTITEPNELQIGFTINDVSCFGNLDGEILVSVSGGTSPYTYSWSNGTGNQDLSDVAIGTYTLSIVDDNGCTNDKTEEIFGPSPVPTPVITVFGDSLVSSTANSYQWYLDGQAVSNANMSYHLAVVSGFYTVEITDTNACVAYSDSVLVALNSIVSNGKFKELIIYPIPVTDELHIGFQSFAQSVVSVRILNKLGQEVYSNTFSNNSNQFSERIHVKKLPEGYYNLILENQGEVMIKKIIKIDSK